MTEDAQSDAPDRDDPLPEADGLWRFGAAASRAMTERVRELYQGLPAGPRRGDVDDELRTLRIDLERAADVSLDLFDRVLALVRRLDAASPPGPSASTDPGETDELVVRASAGRQGSCALWAHNLSDTAQPPPQVRGSALSTFDGVGIPDSCVRVDSGERPIDGANSRRLEVVVDVPEGTPSGSYHGLLLARGEPEVAFRLRVDVA